MSFVDEVIHAVAEDAKNRKEIGIYRYVFPCNPKPYPISGFQHFFGAGFVAARLADFSGMSEEEQAVAFLAGVLHDYEKMGLSLQSLSDLEEFIGSETHLYNVLDEYASGRLKDVVEIASKLESGGLPRRLQLIAEFVRLGDYITGGEESWNIAYVMDRVGETLSRLGVKHHLLPVVIGRQRPVVAMVAEKLNEVLLKDGHTPLVSTPTGSLYLSKSPIESENIKKVYDNLASYISSEVTRALTVTTGKPKVVNLKSVASLVNSSGTKPNVGRIVGSLQNLRQLSVNDIEETFRAYTTPADKMLLAVWSVLAYAKTIGNVKENLQEALNELGLEFIKGRDVQEIAVNLHNHLGKLSPQDLDKVIERIKDRLVKKMLSAEIDIGSIKEVIERTVSVGQHGALDKNSKEKAGGTVCTICRERVSKTKPLRAYLDRLKRILGVNVAELFHPDKQGKPEDYRALEGFSDSVYICPVCEYESTVFPATTSFFDGMWASNIVYYPAVSIDLLRTVKDVAGEYVVVGLRKRKKGETETKPLVIPDYVASRIIVKTSDEHGRLRKDSLLTALDLWYYIGGSLVLTTNALSVPHPWTGLPIEMEVSDVIIEESVNQFMRELRLAKERGEWSRTRRLRRILYDQLRTYVMNLDEAEVEMGKTRFMKSGLVTSGAPALDVYSYAIRRIS